MQSNVINILFLGGSRRVSVAEAFKSAGLTLQRTVNIFAYEMSHLEPISYVGEIVIGLKWADEKIFNDIEKVIAEKQINIVVPFVDIATIICATLQAKLNDVFFCTSTLQMATIMMDKKLSDTWFRENNFNVPSNKNVLPLIAKPNTGSGAKGMYILKNDNDADHFYSMGDTSVFFIQQFIKGDEYSVDCYVEKGGDIVSMVPRKRIEVTNGEATKSITLRDGEIENLTREILIKGKFEGPVTVQYIKQTITNELFVMEINPRLGSGVLTSIQAGANICKFILNEYMGNKTPFVDNWTESLLMVRAYKEYYF